jgi:hypothetical protein
MSTDRPTAAQLAAIIGMKDPGPPPPPMALDDIVEHLGWTLAETMTDLWALRESIDAYVPAERLDAVVAEAARLAALVDQALDLIGTLSVDAGLTGLRNHRS